MSSRTWKIEALHAPLAMQVSHASHTRTTGDSLLVQVQEDGHTGLGEGCPRTYVTGEDVESALVWARSMVPRLETIGSVEDLRAFVLAEAPELDQHPAAWCALESALLDLLARREGTSVEDALGVPATRSTFAYTAVLFELPGPMFQMLAYKHAEYGFRDWKVRASGELEVDTERLETLASMDPASIRLDANNRWAGDVDAAMAHVSALQRVAPLRALEEPLAPRDYAGLSRLSSALELPVVLDESACRPEDLHSLEGLPGAWIVNIKVSKAGGLLRAMAMAEAAQAHGLQVVLGAQVGESSLLTRVAMALARSIPESTLLGQEGAYGRLLVPGDSVAPEIRFGKGGVVDATTIGLGYQGWGMHLEEEDG